MLSSPLVRVELDWRDSRPHERRVDNPRQIELRLRLRSLSAGFVKTNVDGDDLTAAVPSQKRPALDSTETEREIGYHARRMLSGGCIQATRHVECGDACSSCMQVVDRSDRCGDVAPRFSLEAGTEERVNDHRRMVARGLGDLHRLDRRFSLSNSVSRFRLPDFNHCDFHT